MSALRRFRRIALMGYRATGKTHVGAELCRRLKCPVIDTDAEIQTRADCSIREIFEELGEDGFRDYESQVIADVCSDDTPAVLALGGGAVLRELNRTELQRHCAMVWLRATPEEIWRRLQGDAATASQRPALTDLSGFNEIVAVLSARESIYQAMADVQVDTDGKDVPQIANEVLSLLNDKRFSPLPQWLSEADDA